MTDKDVQYIPGQVIFLDEEVPFKKFPKIARHTNVQCTITEKLDGSNALIYISEDLEVVKAGSRSRWITPGKSTDNFGFAQWVEDNKEELKKLGPGYHYGEWVGKGINRGYDIEPKNLFMFNPRWGNQGPDCVDVVPLLGTCKFNELEHMLLNIKDDLLLNGSTLNPNTKAEGVMVFFREFGHYMKVIYDK